MAEYKKNRDKNRLLQYELPSCPGSNVYVPSRLGYGGRIRVRSASYKVHVEVDENGEENVFQVIDPAAAEKEVMIQSLLDSRTYHDLTENGKPIQFNRWWIENEMDENDALWLGQVLVAEMQEELGLEITEETPEAAVEKKEDKKSTGRKKVSLEATPEEMLLP